MKLPIEKHEDDRRTLIEWVKDFPIRTCKVLVMKKDGELGNHYHRRKVDIFYLLRGSGEYKIGKDDWQEFNEGDCLMAEIFKPHSFKLKKDSILLEASSKSFDPKDEIKL